MTADDDALIEVERLLPGGVGLARRADGRVVLVRGVAPGDHVEVPEEASSPQWPTVVEPTSSLRWTHPCPHQARGCGGCDLGFIQPAALIDLKAEMVRDALRRLAGLDDPNLRIGERLRDFAFRNQVRLAHGAEGWGFRRLRTNDVVSIESCPVAESDISDRIATLKPPTSAAVDHAKDLIIRSGIDTVQTGFVSGRKGPVERRVANRTWRVSWGSFFQTRDDGAEALCTAVTDAVGRLGGWATDDEPRIVDLCAGVGLFAGVLADRFPRASITAIESAASSVADARVNLADTSVTVTRGRMENTILPVCDVVVADPPRGGLRAATVKNIVASGTAAVVLVSCDAGSLGRDTGLLMAGGFEPQRFTLIDMFPHTHHVEVVSEFAAKEPER